MAITPAPLPEHEFRAGFADLAKDPQYAALVSKLSPRRFSNMSGRMAAIVGCILGQEFTNPRMAWLSISSDGFVTSDADFIGDSLSLERNLANLLEAADLTPPERELFNKLMATGIEDHRREVPEPEFRV